MLLCAISAVATHQIARTSPTGRVNRPNTIANPPPSSTTTAKAQAASTIGRPCLTNIACVADGPSNLSTADEEQKAQQNAPEEHRCIVGSLHSSFPFSQRLGGSSAVIAQLILQSFKLLRRRHRQEPLY